MAQDIATLMGLAAISNVLGRRQSPRNDKNAFSYYRHFVRNVHAKLIHNIYEYQHCCNVVP
jgi:hypothetical protein